MKKFTLPSIFTSFLLISISAGSFFTSNAIAQSSADCLKQYHNSQAKCSEATKTCIDGCPGAQGVDLGHLSECLRSCSKQEDVCDKAADAAYDSCMKKGQLPATSTPTDITVTKPVQDQKNEKSLEINSQEGKLPFFIGEWFNLVGEWIKLNTLELSLKESEWREEQKEIEELKKKQEETRARLEADWGRTSREAFWKSVAEAKFVAWPGDQSEVYKNQPTAEYKKGGNNEFEPLSDLQILNHGDIIQVTRRAIIRTPNYVIELYPFGIDEKAVVELRDGKLILKDGAVTIWKGGVGNELVGNKYGYGEEVINGVNGIGIRTPVLDTVDVQTRYTVAHDEKANKSYVIVSEGEVKVTTRDGKTATVTPDGDKPGIAIVSQKLSPVKVATISVILVTTVGGAILILRRKFVPKGLNKKRK